jgi:hypothetical protein
MEMKNKPLSLVCNQTVSVLKELNVKRHNDIKPGSKFHKFQGQFREDKVSEVKSKLSGQQSLF